MPLHCGMDPERERRADGQLERRYYPRHLLDKVQALRITRSFRVETTGRLREVERRLDERQEMQVCNCGALALRQRVEELYLIVGALEERIELLKRGENAGYTELR